MKRVSMFAIGLLVISVCVFPATVLALTPRYNGYIETRGVLRDPTGFQSGFMDDTQMVQWITEAQLDFELSNDSLARPLLRFEKLFLRYRVGYDAMLDLSDRYNDIREKSPADFELGKEDIRVENQLKELFVDFSGESASGTSRANLRLGRQIVQWGEADMFNLMNIVNPPDNSNQMFFLDPELLITPLWMARMDLRLPGPGVFKGFNLQFLGIPDIRPAMYAPLHGMYKAPYAFPFSGFAPLPVKEDVEPFGFDDMEMGIRLGTDIGGWNLFLYFFDGYQDIGGIDFSTIATAGAYTFRHPKQKTYGYSFSKYMRYGDFVFRGEGSVTKDATQLDLENLYTGGPGYSEHDYCQILFGFDKSFSAAVPGTDTPLTTSFQLYYAKIDDWRQDAALRPGAEDIYRYTLLLTTDFVHGTITPTVACMADSEDSLMTSLSVNWTPDGRFYINLSQMSFYGDTDGQSPFAPFIDTASEVALKLGYKF